MYYNTVLAKNRPSPVNEDDYRRAFKKVVPEANHEDHYDIAAVVTQFGSVGHALMNESDNRSKDSNFHLCKHFVSDDELRKYL